MWPLVVSALLGLALGARHAFEPDHLAAVTTLVSDRPRPRHAALLGALWGLGHTAALLLVGLLLLVLETSLSPRVEGGLELAVACMLVFLGTRSIVLALRDGRHGPAHPHTHGGHAHVHAGPASHVHVFSRTLALRPLLVGLVHGLAGSGGLAALALSSMPTRTSAAFYILLFGLGSVAGMALVSFLAALSLSRLRTAPPLRTLRLTTGFLAIAVGLAWGALALA